MYNSSDIVFHRNVHSSSPKVHDLNFDQLCYLPSIDIFVEIQHRNDLKDYLSIKNLFNLLNHQ